MARPANRWPPWSPAPLGNLPNRKISAYAVDMRRKPGWLLPLEERMLLTAVSLGEGAEFHGFRLAKLLQEQHGDRKLTAHGTLYKALNRLEEWSLLESRWEAPQAAADERRPRRRLYTVTDEGRAALNRHRRSSPTLVESPLLAPEP